MRIRKFLVAGGNTTALVWEADPNERVAVSNVLLKNAEQVGFVFEDDSKTMLTMMGDELCVDAMLALASLLSSGEQFYAREHTSIHVLEESGGVGITVRLPYQRNGTTVLFDGIGYHYSTTHSDVSKEFLRKEAERYNLPAFGHIYYGEKGIVPTVYVRETDSCVEESACGSGSIACSIMTGETAVLQPTGEFIFVESNGEGFTIRAKVEES